LIHAEVLRFYRAEGRRTKVITAPVGIN